MGVSISEREIHTTPSVKLAKNAGSLKDLRALVDLYLDMVRSSGFNMLDYITLHW